VRTVTDMGGGTGAMPAAILRARLQVRGILVDLGRTVAHARGTAPGDRGGGPCEIRVAKFLRCLARRRQRLPGLRSAQPTGRIASSGNSAADAPKRARPSGTQKALSSKYLAIDGLGGRQAAYLGEFRELARASG
jgi:hypothetical protein